MKWKSATVYLAYENMKLVFNERAQMWYLIYYTVVIVVSFTSHYVSDNNYFRSQFTLSKVVLSCSFQSQGASMKIDLLVEWNFYFVTSCGVSNSSTVGIFSWWTSLVFHYSCDALFYNIGTQLMTLTFDFWNNYYVTLWSLVNMAVPCLYIEIPWSIFWPFLQGSHSGQS